MKARGLVPEMALFTQSKTVKLASLYVASSLATDRLMLSRLPEKASVTLSVRWAFGPWGFYIWIHSGPQLITEGYGEARGEGLFPSDKISESLTHSACGIPPLPKL